MSLIISITDISTLIIIMIRQGVRFWAVGKKMKGMEKCPALFMLSSFEKNVGQ